MACEVVELAWESSFLLLDFVVILGAKLGLRLRLHFPTNWAFDEFCAKLFDAVVLSQGRCNREKRFFLKLTGIMLSMTRVGRACAEHCAFTLPHSFPK